MANLGATELLLILLLVLVLFGAKKLPDLAQGVGEALKRFKDTQKNPEDKDKINKE